MIWLFNLEAGGSLVRYIDQFQGLGILWPEIYQSIESKGQLVNQMVKHIEDSLLSGPCKSIKTGMPIGIIFVTPQLPCGPTN